MTSPKEDGRLGTSAAEDLRGNICEAIMDSMGPDWSSGVGADAVMEIPLIAAAPEMLEALEAVVSELMAGDEYEAYAIAKNAGLAAIAKARGQ